MKKYWLITVFVLIAPLFLGAQNASLKGRVYNQQNNEPLPFVNVVVSGTTIGAITDTNGKFQLDGIEPGFIRVEASFVGFKRAISAEIEVSASKIPYIEIPLEESNTEIDEVTIKASPFRKTEESPVSLKTIGISEIENSPGANRDISKVIQSFPGVQSSPSFRNDIVIRGGGPSESRFYLDGVEVPFINHFATQGASGGPVGIINADLLREVEYYSGAFPANRGNALSGVFEFAQKDGNTEKFQFKTSLGASEVTATLDGPISENTSLTFSARRSYLKFLFSLIELPFLPTFNDMQFKLRSRIDQKNEITFVGLGAIDLFDLNQDIEDPDARQKYILSQIPVNEQWSYTLGAVYKHFRDNSYQTVVLSRSHLNNTSIKYFENDDSSQENKILDYSSEEIENKFRLENSTRIDGFKFNAGINIDLVTYKNNTQQRRFYGDDIVNVNYSTNLNLAKWGAFAQVSKSVFEERLVLSAGARMDANNYSKDMNNLFKQFSPRLSASYLLTDKWSINANIGKYYQLPSYTSLGFRQNGEMVNKNNELKYISAAHYIAGVEFRPSQMVLFSMEGFSKKYNDYPFSVKDQISLANKGADFGVIGDEEVTSDSKGKAYGAEFITRINTQNGFNLNLSYTLVRSEFTDASGQYAPSSWDSRNLLVLTSTKTMKKGWLVGVRWRFAGGLPYTPYDLERSSLVEAWNLKGAPYHDFSRLNQERFDAFHQLDLRIDKAYYLKRLTAKFYIDVQNLYGFESDEQDIIVRKEDANGNFVLTDNATRYVFEEVPNSSGTVLPTIGIILEF